MNNSVSSLTVYNGDLIAGGMFTTAGGVAASAIARWDGSTWQPLGSGVDLPGPGGPSVYSLTVYNDELIAGGFFTTADGDAANYIVRWDGSTWQPLGSGMNYYVNSLTVYNGDLIAGGVFTTAGGKASAYIARWDKPCCIGITGNVDGDPAEIVDIGDMTRLIDYLFISYEEPECMPEANVDGSTDGVVDIGDVTKLIDYLFISFTPPAPCP